MKARNVLAASVAASLSMGAVQSAEAAYAYAYQDIWNFQISGTALTESSIISNPTFTSTTSSSRHDAAPDGSQVPFDAQPAWSGNGPKYANNAAYQGTGNSSPGEFIGETNDYGTGDAWIVNFNVFDGGEAWNFAEAYAPGESGQFNHSGSGQNTLAVEFTAQDNAPVIVDYDWLAEWRARVDLPGTAPPGTQAVATITFNITIFDEDDEAVDAFSPTAQNRAFSADISNPTRSSNTSGMVNWQSVNLVQGENYRFEVSAFESAQASQEEPHGNPVPATLALMGLGLVGFGARRRIKRS
jgi:hypothetical protein